jgi:hypothetical protein
MISPATRLIIFATAFVASATAAGAAGKFDSRWTAVLATKSGPCNVAYRGAVQVINGIVEVQGAPNNVLSGRVRHRQMARSHAKWGMHRCLDSAAAISLIYPKKGTGTMAGPPQLPALAFRNNRRRRRSFAFAVRCSVGLCRGRDAKESKRRCRQ